ncbi:four helix bundle protein [Siphonobacter sp. SORGH_AS_1065]|uniref:four helix bundle protein n=1 Tax=Siphonobacter sp. SORGH_AS_1065 TaxID=3041795 RepID=UPI002783FB3D|nr:four helix bundle protein [Siphonobacter sp. SORGH_AS_1065]MDQ1088374.1 four helix bundle protein [Siphonobacter sp. SORGH_AS_1065]
MEPLTQKEAFVEEFKNRTQQFVIRSIRLFQALPKTDEARIIGKQFLRSASSVGANYRAACRARSRAEFYAKISITIEEADESLFWLEIIRETDLMSAKRLEELMKEALEIVKVLAKARKNSKTMNE